MSIFLVTRTFVTETSVSAPPEAVLAFLADLPAFFRLNPLVIAVEPSPGDRYRVSDRLRFLGVPFTIHYQVHAVHVAGGLDAEVWTAPATHLRNAIRVTPEGAGARVRESVQMTAPRILAGYALATARAAHRDLFARLKDAVEARGVS
jgi:hypothetical protein